MSTPLPTVQPTSAWGIKPVWGQTTPENMSSTSSYNEAVSLNDVMSEQLATHLQIVEDTAYVTAIADVVPEELPIALALADSFAFGFDQDEVADTSSDAALAHMMQLAFDREQEEHRTREVSKSNGTSGEVSVSFDMFKRLPTGSLTDSEDDDEEDGVRFFDKFEEEKKINSGLTIGKQGFAKQGNKVVVTKHDLNTSGRRNTERLLEFSSNISTGDGGGFDMKLSNKVYNDLKLHSISTGKRMARLHEKKEKSTAENVMDENTHLIVFKLINQGLLDEMNGAISTGKEANVYHGIGGNPEKQVTVGEVAIKVYKTTLSEFKNRDPYIKNDFRFRERFSKQNPRKIIHLWAEKEMHNLMRIRKAGLPCPEVVVLKKHILVMTFIGSDGKSAPTLKEAVLSQTQLQQAYDEVVDIMKKLWAKCDIVHADLSEFNLLWHVNRVYVIDVGQAVLIGHPEALGFLLRDCSNITNFFAKRGATTVSSAELFESICGKALSDGNLDNVVLLNRIEEFERDEEILTHGMNRTGDPFDEMFTKAVQEKQADDGMGMPIPCPNNGQTVNGHSKASPKGRAAFPNKLSKSPPKPVTKK